MTPAPDGLDALGTVVVVLACMYIAAFVAIAINKLLDSDNQ